MLLQGKVTGVTQKIPVLRKYLFITILKYSVYKVAQN